MTSQAIDPTEVSASPPATPPAPCVGAASALPELPADPGAVSHEERERLTARCLAVAVGADSHVGEEAARRVVLLNMRVARAVSHRYRDRGVPTDDLEQIAYVALVRVAHSFDPTQGKDFLAFAVPSITGELRRHFRDHGWVIRPPRPVQRAHGRLLEERPDLERASTDELRELAERTGEQEDVIEEALRLRSQMRPVSLDHLGVDRDDAEGPAEIPDERLDFAPSAEARLLLGAAARDLSPSDRCLLKWRFVDELSQREIAARLGVSQVSVSRMLSRLLSRLREQLGTAA